MLWVEVKVMVVVEMLMKLLLAVTCVMNRVEVKVEKEYKMEVGDYNRLR